MGLKIMEISTTNAERPAPMSDVALAKNLVAEIAGDCWGGKADMIDRVYDTIDQYFREMGRPVHHWTRRRVRAFWHREAAGVRYHEMVELATVAAAAKRYRAEEEAKHQARKDHAEFVARTARMATALAVSDEEFHRDAIEMFSRIQGGRADSQVGHLARQGHGDLGQGNRSRGALGAGDRS